MVLRVKPTPTRFPTNILSTPVDNTILHSISCVVSERQMQMLLRQRHGEGEGVSVADVFTRASGFF